MMALHRGKPNIDDFGTELQTFTIYNVSRDLIIGCNENNLSWWLRNTNEPKPDKKGSITTQWLPVINQQHLDQLLSITAKPTEQGERQL